MTTRPLTIAVLLSLLAPLAVRAEGDKPAPTTEQSAAAPLPAAPAPNPAPPPAPAAKPPAVTWELSGWLILNTWADSGAFNAADLPRYAVPIKHEKATGMSVRQSRIRFGIGVPDDGGLVGGAALKGFIETDFVGGYANNSTDESAPVLRLRHAYVTATWKNLGNLTVLVGQTGDIWHGAVAPQSLAHLAVARFGAAGYLYRRAPQLRVSGEVGGKDVAVTWQLGAISAMDKTTQLANGTSVGYRSSMPDLEGRLAFVVRGSSPVKVELGVGGRYASEKYQLAGVADVPDKTVRSRGVAADLKLEVGPVTLVGGAFAGENLDVDNALSPGVLTTVDTNGAMTSVKSIPTVGGWAQLQLVPVKAVTLLAGAGVETPRKKLLPASVSLGAVKIPAVERNLQYSGGILVNLNPRWRVGLEVTHYATRGVDRKTTEADQFELSSLLSI